MSSTENKPYAMDIHDLATHSLNRIVVIFAANIDEAFELARDGMDDGESCTVGRAAEYPTGPGQIVLSIESGKRGVTTSPPRARTSQIGVIWFGGHYPVLELVTELLRA